MTRFSINSRRLAALAAALLVGAAAYAPFAQTQAPPPDLGDERLLVLACDYLRLAAEQEGYLFVYCRQRGPLEQTGNRAELPVTVKLGGFPKISLDVHLQKSLWTVQAFS